MALSSSSQKSVELDRKTCPVNGWRYLHVIYAGAFDLQWCGANLTVAWHGSFCYFAVKA
ncbi:MAG: hypothetical protein RIC06_01740 [Cyclobacteriaceae bacterium]